MRLVGYLPSHIQRALLEWLLFIIWLCPTRTGNYKFTNLIGWNGYWPRSRFSHIDLHLAQQCFEVKKLQTKLQKHWLFSFNNIYFCKYQKADATKESKQDEQTLEELNSAHRRSQAKCQLVQTSHINELNFYCFFHIINISVWENLELGRAYRPAFGLYLGSRSRFSHN